MPAFFALMSCTVRLNTRQRTASSINFERSLFSYPGHRGRCGEGKISLFRDRDSPADGFFFHFGTYTLKRLNAFALIHCRSESGFVQVVSVNFLPCTFCEGIKAGKSACRITTGIHGILALLYYGDLNSRSSLLGVSSENSDPPHSGNSEPSSDSHKR
jgi:hypothetical protein